MLEALAEGAGLSAAAYTSPHLLRFNERMRINGRAAGNAEIVAAFEEVEAARGDVPLTFFEFTTLAAFHLFAARGVELAFLEVGMGGRLDAVNLLTPDVAIVTSIGLDHCEWLGSDREAIGFEKASIFRKNRYSICADEEPPESVRRLARPTRAHFAGEDFHWSREGKDGWCWRGQDSQGRSLEHSGLPRPCLAEESAAAALQAWHCLGQSAERPVLEAGLAATLSGRRERRHAGGRQFILDGAHNPSAARHLARWLAEETGAVSIPAVCGMLKDKDCLGFAEALGVAVGPWYLTEPSGQPRALPAAALRDAFCKAGCEVRGSYRSVAEAMERASSETAAGLPILVTGSLFTVADAISSLQSGTAEAEIGGTL